MDFTNKSHSPPPTTYYWTSPLTSMPPHRRRSPPSLISFLNSPLLIIVCPVIIILFIFFALPSFLSLTSHIIKPTIHVKKSWDSLNVVLVLFAILCGIFAKRNDDGLSSTDRDNDERSQNTVLSSSVSSNTSSSSSSSYAMKDEGESVSLPTQWFAFSETKFHDDTPIHYSPSPATGMTRLRRSSSSYPDLRQESLWETGSGERYQFRFYDDFGIDKFRSPPTDQVNVDDRKRQGEVEEDVGVKVIPVDTFELRSSMAAPQKSPATPPPPPPPPPPRHARQRPSRRYQTVHPKDGLDGERRIINDSEELTSVQRPPPPTPPPPPPPPPSVQKRSEQKHTKSQRRSSVKRDLAMVWATLSNQKKRKKKQKMKNNYFHGYNPASQSSVQTPKYTGPPPSPPPPPPPPPPPSVFRSLFKKGTSKSKQVHSIPITPPPPPPPLPPRAPLSSSARKSKHKKNFDPPSAPPPPSCSQIQNSINSGKPPLPKRVSTHLNEETINSGNQSPLIPIPPPPPPPFRMPEMKFIFQGDFVKIRSNHSSRCGSPELEDADDEPSKEEVNTIHVVHGSHHSGPTFCPSPDVNVKAATFIARLRGEWKLEKLNSMKEKGNLSHSPGP